MKFTKLASCMVLLAASTCSYPQSTFVYTNNNPSGPNSVSAFSIGSDGALTPIAGSPFATGGSGVGNGLFGSSYITIAAKFLYASNNGSNSITGFSIDTNTGVLTPVPGSPFATGQGGFSGISLAVAPNNEFLYAGNAATSNISAFSIGSDGALTSIAGSPFALQNCQNCAPDGIKVSPDGNFLAVALPNNYGTSVAMFSIRSDGALSPVPGSPFNVGDDYSVSVEMNCASNLLFAPQADLGFKVDVTTIGTSGVLTPIAGSPFNFPGGSFSSLGVLSPDELHLFVSNPYSNTMSSLNVTSAGLTAVPGSPFDNPGGSQPSGVAMNQKGTFIYIANVPGMVTGFSIGSNASLSPVPGSPFSTGSGWGLLSLAVFPPRSCSYDKAVVQPPINADGSSVFKSKRGVVPVKFSLTHNDAPTCSLPPATMAVTRTAGGTLGSVDESIYSMQADSGSTFRIDPTACQYVYNLAASSLGVGTYRVDISINGIMVGHAAFALK